MNVTYELQNTLSGFSNTVSSYLALQTNTVRRPREDQTKIRLNQLFKKKTVSTNTVTIQNTISYLITFDLISIIILVVVDVIIVIIIIIIQLRFAFSFIFTFYNCLFNINVNI